MAVLTVRRALCYNIATVVAVTVVAKREDIVMRFFDRARELADLKEIRERSESVAQFTVVTGRRRVGKTSLVVKSLEGEEYVYLFVERKSEKDLCETFVREINEKLGEVVFGTPERIEDVFLALMKIASTRHLNVVIDEFQEFRKVNPSIFSSIQKTWDMHKDSARINLIVTGSVNTLMVRLFRNKRAALYGRETAFMVVEPFATSVLKEILSAYHPRYKAEDLLALWTFTGGVAKYVELLVDSRCWTRDAMIKEMIRANSLFLDEGRAMLVEEFDREYGVYFSVLCAIARGRTTRNEIEQTVGRQVGGYLARLEEDYALIRKRHPIFAKVAAKTARYELNDNFLVFWFRFMYRYSYILELKGYEQLREIVRRDYPVLSGHALELYFKHQLAESGQWTRIGGWWDRKGENELDILAENELTGTYAVCEVKRQGSKIDLNVVADKFAAFRKATGKWLKAKPRFLALSMSDM
jgi:AAA+ ATPase superfamily predicted ATPase